VVLRVSEIITAPRMTCAAKERMMDEEKVDPRQVDALVMLPPYIKPEHAELLGRACAALFEHEQLLLSRLQKSYPAAISIGCVESMREIQRLFMSDPVRWEMVKTISSMRLCYEQPRFMVKLTA